MSRELEIVEQLILGQDPLHRGQALRTPKDPALDQARAHYYQQLKRVSKQHAAQSAPPSAPAHPGHSRAGERWSIAEDNQNNFGYERARQALWITHPDHGITFSMPVNVDDENAAAPSGGGEAWVSWKG